MELLKSLLGMNRNGIQLFLFFHLRVWLVFFGDSLLPFCQVRFTQVLKLAVVWQEPSDEVDVGRQSILDLQCVFALGVFVDHLSDRWATKEILWRPFEYLSAVHEADEVFQAMIEQLKHLFADSDTDWIQMVQDGVNRVKHLVGEDFEAFVPLIDSIQNTL